MDPKETGPIKADEIRVDGLLPALPAQVYEAWLDAANHGAMTGSEATSDPRPGGRFTAWDGYIEGTHEELYPPHRIVQRWRTSEFPADAPDSRLEVHLAPHPEGTAVTFVHTGIPAGQGAAYEQGWVDHYLTPMRQYFVER